MSPVQGPSVGSLLLLALLLLALLLLLHFGLLGLARDALVLLGASSVGLHIRVRIAGAAAGVGRALVSLLWTRTCPCLRPALNFVGTELGISPMARPHTGLLGGGLQGCSQVELHGGERSCVLRPRAPGPCRGAEQGEER
uniref:Yip1 interacting factor homolog B n=1 Tax=Pan troglodytes TaxID=9598 RepID=K7CTB0_PANTR